jgi:type II secretory pathway component PulC
MQRIHLSKWLSIVAISLLSAAIGWKIADTLNNPPEVTPAQSASEKAESLVAENPSPPQMDIKPIADTTAVEAVLMLKIIFPATDNQGRIAIIQHRNKQANAFETGQAVFGLATLKEINEDHIILLQDSRRVRLSLRNSYAKHEIDNPAGEQSVSETPNAGEIYTGAEPGSIRDLALRAGTRVRADKNTKPVKLYRERKLVYTKDLIASLAQAKQDSIETSSDRTWAFLQYEPDIQVDGVKGLKLTGHEESEFLAQYGIEYGDVITSVNGKKLDTPAAATEGMNVIGESGTLELIIERGSQVHKITVNKKTAPSN